MYVCICNAYTETDIRDAAAEGARTTDEVYWTIGDGPCCRRCVSTAQQIIDEVHADAPRVSATKRDPSRSPGPPGAAAMGQNPAIEAA